MHTSPPRSMGMTGSVVKVEGVTKRFAGHTAVEALSLEVPTGGIFGLLGPNGAGKSTTIRMIMNIIVPDENIDMFADFSLLRCHAISKTWVEYP